jgi:hypothetical protein
VKPPPTDAIEFLGSSTIRMWELDRWFPGMPVFNRGSGGSEIEDSARFVPRIVLKNHPRLIVFCAGDNEVNAFSGEVHRALPETKILFLSIKPILARVNQIPGQQEANRLVAGYCKAKRWLQFVDMTDLMLDAGGKLRPELFRPDALHMTGTGYALWSARLKLLLQ